MLESEKDNKSRLTLDCLGYGHLATSHHAAATAVRALHFNGGGQNTGHGDKKYTLYIQLSSDSDFTVSTLGQGTVDFTVSTLGQGMVVVVHCV